MRHAFLTVAIGAALVIGVGGVEAASISGYLDDSGNLALAASDGYQDLRAARFGNDDEIARNVALYELTVLSEGTFSFSSLGWAKGGAEPYFTLFAGSGLAAAFLDSNGLSDPFTIDFSISRFLQAGTHMMALGVWENMSFAENNPDLDPSLADGFTALGDPGRLGNYYYEVVISSADAEFEEPRPAGDLRNPTPAPEPSALLLIACGASGALARVRRRRQ